MVSVVIPAAGSGSRLGGQPKQLRHLGNAPLIFQTACIFDQHPEIHNLAVAGPAEQLDEIKEILSPLAKPCQVVQGGATRQHSVQAGLSALGESTAIVLVHDAARPFVSERVITDVIDAAKAHGAAAAALCVTDTVRYGEDDSFTSTVSREGLYAMQTPQGFRYDLLLRAFREAGDVSRATDDAELMHHIGQSVRIVPGERSNIKITTQSDWDWASQVWSKQKTVQ